MNRAFAWCLTATMSLGASTALSSCKSAATAADAATTADVSSGSDGAVTDAGPAADSGDVNDPDAIADVGSPFADVADDVPPSVGLWTALTVPGASNYALHGLWTEGTTRAITVGTSGSVFTFNGLGWTKVESDHFSTLNAVTASQGAQTAFAVGMTGTVIQAKGDANGPGKNWAIPGGCTKPADCEDGDPCTTDSCNGGACTHTSSGALGCCGGVAFADSFDKGLGKWTTTDTALAMGGGGIIWSAAGMSSTDGKPRYTSPSKSAYFGRTDQPCPGNAGQDCGTFDNGKVVGSTMTSLDIVLPNAEKVTLSFQLFLDVGASFDALTVRVVPTGQIGQIVWNRNDYYPQGSTGGNFAAQQVDLTMFAGQTVKLEIRFDSQTAFDNNGEGVFIDDLVLSSTCAPAANSGKGVTDATLFATWGAADDDVWAVGTGGTLVHWDGKKWSPTMGPVTKTLRAIWGFAADDIWVVGEAATVLHYDGQSWSQVLIPDYQPDPTQKPYTVKSNFLAVWGAAADDIWAGGLHDDQGKGVLIHWDGSAWAYQPIFQDETREVHAIWGFAKDRILMAGTQGMVLQFDGTQTFTELHPGTIATLFAISGFGKDALIVGDIGTVLRFTPLDQPTTTP